MDASDAARQVEELLALKDQWYGNDGAIEVTTPALFSRLQRVGPAASGRRLEVKKCLAFRVKCGILHPDELSDLILAFEFPLDYPSGSTCRVRALRASDSGREYPSCTAAIERYLEAFRGCECVEMVLEWIAENKGTCLHESDGGSGVGDGGALSPSFGVDGNGGKVQCHVLRYNHLLSGPEHKKEKAMLDAAKKSKLQGGLLWGTPGIVVVVPPSKEEEAREYASECRTIGKRPDGMEEMWLPHTGIEEAGLGGLAQQKRGGKLQELDTAGLRVACGGDEHLLRTVLGVQ